MQLPIPLPAILRPSPASRGERLERLYREHGDRIYGLCVRMTGDAAAAEALVQAIFVRAWDALDLLVPEREAGAWLWRIAVTVLMERRRPHGAARRGRGRAEPATGLAALVRRLPARARAIYLLHDVEGYGRDAIAAMLGVAPGAVRSELHRARAVLREGLRP